MPATTDGAAASRRWPHLPPELLREISGRLDAGADLVRFHAVCRPWRDTLDRPLRFLPWTDLPPQWHSTLGCRTPSFLPWLLAPSESHPRVTAADDADSALLADQRCRCRCVFSKTSFRAPGICLRDKRVACADGTAAWLVSSHHETRLVDPLTAESLPFSREDLKNNKWPHRPYRTVSGDGSGTIFVYDFTTWPPGARLPPGAHHPYSTFWGSFLRPGDEQWWHVLEGLGTDRCCAAVYFYGHIVCVNLANCYVIGKTQTKLPDEPGKVRRRSYLLVSTDDELLLASVFQDACTPGDLSVSLHALYPAADQNGGEELLLEWARRDDDIVMSLLGEDVMFLGFPGSFAVDEELFSGEESGGTAYFVVDS
ncbi:hypothetical protein BAE44_0018869 [Dichanthelium oligosanthes]|uniref:F-box domain-containing protein n=1 Tax=Dichanthelium oligosanthes TaxID=888268 RepID=A0A1E5V4N2_9POAL|nr:hypothetical protein BAE44_0018869 [Dichanthelium oligosanthes]